MLERLREHLAASGLISVGEKVVVGYSGGADSTAMLHLLHLAGIDVIAAHLHHGQRDEADQELLECEKFCASIDVPFVSGKADVPRIAEETKVGLEEAGRNARYTFLRTVASRFGCSLIATAHTRNDLVETVLFNLARGTGLTGLAGILPKRGQIVRPLLSFTRTETRDYCKEQGFWTHDDPANSDLQFSRARIRHRVLPELRLINSKADEAIERLSKLAREEDDYLDSIGGAALQHAEMPLNGELQFLTSDVEAAFRREVVAKLHPVILRRALHLAAHAFGGQLSSQLISVLESQLRQDGKGSITTEGGEVVLEWDLERVHFRKLLPTGAYRQNLTIPGETISDEFGWVLEAWDAEAAAPKPQRKAMEVDLDRSELRGELYIRSFKEGDTMRPLGFEGSRKVSDLYGEARLTAAARLRLPIICDMLGPVWIPNICLDERVKVTDQTQKALHIRFLRIN